MIGAFRCVVWDVSMQLPSRHTHTKKKENSTKGECSVGMTTRPSQSLKSYWAQLRAFGQMCIGVSVHTQIWRAGGWHSHRCVSRRQAKHVSVKIIVPLMSPKNTPHRTESRWSHTASQQKTSVWCSSPQMNPTLQKPFPGCDLCLRIFRLRRLCIPSLINAKTSLPAMQKKKKKG